MFMGGDDDPPESSGPKSRNQTSILLGGKRYRDECPTFFYDCSFYYALGGVKARDDSHAISRGSMWDKFGKPFHVLGMAFKDVETERDFQADRARRSKQFLQLVLQVRIALCLTLFAFECRSYGWDYAKVVEVFYSLHDVWRLNVNLLSMVVFALQLVMQITCLEFVLRNFTRLQIPFCIMHICIIFWGVAVGSTFETLFCPLTWEDVFEGTYNVTVAQTHSVVSDRSLAMMWVLVVTTDFLLLYRLPFLYNLYGVVLMIGGCFYFTGDPRWMIDADSVCRVSLMDIVSMCVVLLCELILSQFFERLWRIDYAMAATVFQESKRSDRLLANVLPVSVIDQLKTANQTRQSVVKHLTLVSVLFADIVSFTTMSARLDAETLVELLNRLFLAFDNICEANQLEKIKTIGDCYMCAGGVPIENNHHFIDIALMGLQMVDVLGQGVFRDPVTNEPLRVRVGCHCGPVTAGVIGQTKFLYDLWGDAVNTASRMESHGQPMRVHCSQDMATLLQGRFELEDRGEMYIKGKGNMRTYFIDQHIQRKLKWRTME